MCVWEWEYGGGVGDLCVRESVCVCGGGEECMCVCVWLGELTVQTCP